MKILLSAYACNPERGSEPGVGWHWVKELSKNNEVWVLFYRGGGQEEAVERACASLPQRQNIHLYPIDVPSIVRTRAYRVRYELWQRAAYRTAKELTRQVEFALIHHVTIAAWWNCGHLWRLPIPFVFGPISGAQQAPAAAYNLMRKRDAASEMVRTLTFHLAWRLWRRPRKAMRRAAVVAVTNHETLSLVSKLRGKGTTVLMRQNGIDAVDHTSESSQAPVSQGPLRLFYAGQLIPCKNFGLLLGALRVLPASIDWRLRVAGTGPLLPYWIRKAKEYGIADRIDFLGQVKHSSMSNLYSWANVFVFPSCRDTNPTAALEAMMHGLPIVALRISGIVTMLDERAAILIDVHNPGQMVNDFAGALRELHLNTALRGRLGSAAREIAMSELSWSRRGAEMEDLYGLVVSQSATDRTAHEESVAVSGSAGPK